MVQLRDAKTHDDDDEINRSLKTQHSVGKLQQPSLDHSLAHERPWHASSQTHEHRVLGNLVKPTRSIQRTGPLVRQSDMQVQALQACVSGQCFANVEQLTSHSLAPKGWIDGDVGEQGLVVRRLQCGKALAPNCREGE